MHKCRESKEPLTKTPATNEDLALLAPSCLRSVCDQIGSGQAAQDVCVCVCVCVHVCVCVIRS